MIKPFTIVLLAWTLVFGPFIAPTRAQWAGVLGASRASGGGTPTLLYDSYNVSGQGTWDSSVGIPGQENFTVSTATSVTKISAYLDSSYTHGELVSCSIYSGTTGSDIVPASPLGTAIPVSVGTGTKVSTDFNFVVPVSLSPGTVYHIGWVSSAYTFGNFQLYYTNPTLIPGQLCLWNITGSNQYPTTFPGYDIQMQLWGTTP